MPLQGTSREALADYAETQMGCEARARAEAILAGMDRGDLRETVWAIQDMAEVMSGMSERSRGPGVAMGQMLAVNCAEEITFAAPPVAEDYIAASPYPGVLVQSVEDDRRAYAAGGFFAAPFERDGMLSPVESDIPALM